MDIYRVDLPGLSERFVDLRAHLPDVARYPIVWVKTKQFIRLWRESIASFNDTPIYEEWPDDKKRGIRYFLVRPGYAPVSRINCEIREYSKTRWFGLKKQMYDQVYIGFSNGRHRTEFMHAMGAERIPVQVNSIDAAQLLDGICGSNR
jgi:hypothetical protein